MGFDGFHRDGVKWFQQLAEKQDRDWFNAHKAEYQQLWVEPMKALFAEVKAPLAAAFKPYRLADPKIFRIYRDVRFSNDKTPYKTSIAGVISIDVGGPERDDMRPAALYLSLGYEEESAAGHYFLSPEMLVKYRKVLLDEKKGAALQRQVDQQLEAGRSVMSMQTLKRPPPGVEKDHPRLGLLREKGLALSFPTIPRAVRFSKSLAGWLVEQATAAAPVVKAIEKIIG